MLHRQKCWTLHDANKNQRCSLTGRVSSSSDVRAYTCVCNVCMWEVITNIRAPSPIVFVRARRAFEREGTDPQFPSPVGCRPITLVFRDRDIRNSNARISLCLGLQISDHKLLPVAARIFKQRGGEGGGGDSKNHACILLLSILPLFPYSALPSPISFMWSRVRNVRILRGRCWILRASTVREKRLIFVTIIAR